MMGSNQQKNEKRSTNKYITNYFWPLNLHRCCQDLVANSPYILWRQSNSVGLSPGLGLNMPEIKNGKQINQCLTKCLPHIWRNSSSAPVGIWPHSLCSVFGVVLVDFHAPNLALSFHWFPRYFHHPLQCPPSFPHQFFHLFESLIPSSIHHCLLWCAKPMKLAHPPPICQNKFGPAIFAS